MYHSSCNLMLRRTEQQSLRARAWRAESEPGKGREIGGGKYTPTQTAVIIIETAVMETPLSFF